jgi:hypothetical protein
MGLLFRRIEKMNCQEIKNKLEEKDKQILERNEKNAEYFNLIKDDVVDKLIEAHINDEFKRDFYHFHELDIMGNLYSKLGINRKYIKIKCIPIANYAYWYWDEDVYFTDCLYLDEKEIQDINEMRKMFLDVKENLNHAMLKESLAYYIVAKGFKQRQYKFCDGKVYYFNEFKITRSQLENNCCDSVSSYEFHVTSNEIEEQHEIKKQSYGKKIPIIGTKEFIQCALAMVFGIIVFLIRENPEIAHLLALFLLLIIFTVYSFTDKSNN